MKRYVRQSDNTVHYIADIRRENPESSIPDDADCSDFGYDYLVEIPAPAVSWLYTVQEGPPVNNEQTWVVAEKELNYCKSELVARINEKRDSIEAGGFPYLGKVLDSDPRSVQRINTAVQAAQAAVAAGVPFGIDWVCADNSVVTLDAAGMIGAPVALATYANQAHTFARTLKDQANAALTIAELEAIDIEAGWPTSG